MIRQERMTAVFVDIRDYTHFCKVEKPIVVAHALLHFFARLDTLSVRYGMRKIKTNGDQYIAICRAADGHACYPDLACRFALELLQIMQSASKLSRKQSVVRIGISTGVAAIFIKRDVAMWDVWGHTINLAARLETVAITFPILVCENTYSKTKYRFRYQQSIQMPLKGIGNYPCYPLHYDDDDIHTITL